jgi:hypothetical protein
MPARRTLLALALLAAAALQAAPALALTVTVGRVGGVTWDMTDPTVAPYATLTGPDANGVSTWSLNQPFVKANYTVDSMTLTLKEDPFVTNNTTITNTGLATATFVVTVLLPIPSFSYNTVINSSVGITATDSNGNGSLLVDNAGATPIYQGLGGFPTPVLLSLNPNSPGTLPITTADCPVSFPGCTATSATGVASLGVPSGTTSLIGIILTFQLSAGDSAGLTSRFEIANVPEPATVALLAVGLAALAVARRRTS